MPKGTNAHSLDAIAPFRFKKGSAPGPGRRKKLPVNAEYQKILSEKLSTTRIGEELRDKLGLKKSATWARAIALGQARLAVTNPSAAREIRESTDGKSIARLRIEEGSESLPTEEKQTEDDLRRDVLTLFDRLRNRVRNAGGTSGDQGQTSAA